MAALHQKQGHHHIAEGLYRKAAVKCKEYLRMKKNDLRNLIIYGQTLINVAITAVAAHGHKLAEPDLQHALKVNVPPTHQPQLSQSHWRRPIAGFRFGRKLRPAPSLSTRLLAATGYRLRSR
jgi:hypothetical protein